MCLGAVVWSGVQTLVCGATDGDARAVGFDEGPKPPDWVSTLYQRGITVHRDVLRPDAAGVLQAYADAAGPSTTAPLVAAAATTALVAMRPQAAL